MEIPTAEAAAAGAHSLGAAAGLPAALREAAEQQYVRDQLTTGKVAPGEALTSEKQFQQFLKELGGSRPAGGGASDAEEGEIPDAGRADSGAKGEEPVDPCNLYVGYVPLRIDSA